MTPRPPDVRRPLPSQQPNKAEKEPIREYYDAYNRLKTRIRDLQASAAASTASPPKSEPAPHVFRNTRTGDLTVSRTGSKGAGAPDGSGRGAKGSAGEAEGDHDLEPGRPEHEGDGEEAGDVGPGDGRGRAKGGAGEDGGLSLHDLKMQKRALHARLRSFEKKFEKLHGTPAHRGLASKSPRLSA
jgi:hypothetical protein